MGTVTAAISVSAAAAAVVSRPADRRRHRGPAAFRCSASAASERQALFSRIAPVYDHVRTSCSPLSPRCSYEISAADSNVRLSC